MGVWGSGNFDNDVAGDYFLGFAKRLIIDIEITMGDAFQLEAGSYWSDIVPCMVEILTVLGKQDFHPYPLDIKEVKRWKRIYMEFWYMTIDNTEPTPEYRKEREEILIKTFDDLIELLENEQKN